MSSTDAGGVNARDLIWPIAIMFVALVGGVVALAIFLPESRDVTVIVTPLVGTFGTLLATLGIWVTVRRTGEKVDKVAEVVENTAVDVAETKHNTNGGLTKKVNEIAVTSVARVLADHLDPSERPDPPSF